MSDLETYYNRGREQDRLTRAAGKLELARTQEIILRYLPPAPAVVLDIGGGAGIHSVWLAELGYAMHLVDLIPLHIEQAAQSAGHLLASAQVGDAQKLNFPDASADALLLLGPLYHLQDRAQRVQALCEACRVLKPSGLLFAATISRFASLLDAFSLGYFKDDYYTELLNGVLSDGKHHNPRQQPGYFTSAFFHHPDEIRAEVNDAGFQVEKLLAIEGMAGFMPDFDTIWNDETLRERLLGLLRTVESDPAIIGATGHLMTVARKR